MVSPSYIRQFDSALAHNNQNLKIMNLEKFLNSDDPEGCPYCDGGENFFVLDDDAEDGEREITRDEYLVSPHNIRERRLCTHCRGTGLK